VWLTHFVLWQGSVRGVAFLVDEFAGPRWGFFGAVAAKRALVAAALHTAHAGLDGFVLGLVCLLFLLVVVCAR
jgi:hypothetical protein